MKKFDRVKAVVSLDAIAHNFEEMKKNIAEGTKIVAVIKADGYGHGAEAIARLIEDYEYIWGYATATPEEALQLRDAGIDKPILILGIVFEEYYKELIAHEVRMTVCEYEMAAALSEEAVRQGRKVHIHIGLDTGMSRIGFADVPESVETIKKIAALPNVEIEVEWTEADSKIREIEWRNPFGFFFLPPGTVKEPKTPFPYYYVVIAKLNL